MRSEKESAIVESISSLLGAFSAVTLCSPLDVIKTRFQIQVRISPCDHP